jgi:hypothetical protein
MRPWDTNYRSTSYAQAVMSSVKLPIIADLEVVGPTEGVLVVFLRAVFLYHEGW